jgi:hypothetical protein
MAPKGWNEFLAVVVASGTEIYVDSAIGLDPVASDYNDVAVVIAACSVPVVEKRSANR